MPYRVVVDEELCVGSGACVVAAPEAFRFKDGLQGIAEPLPPAHDLDEERQRELADVCPMEAIQLVPPA